MTEDDLTPKLNAAIHWTEHAEAYVNRITEENADLKRLLAKQNDKSEGRKKFVDALEAASVKLMKENQDLKKVIVGFKSRNHQLSRKIQAQKMRIERMQKKISSITGRK